MKIKKNKDNVKFKVRCSRYLYTLVIQDTEKAEKLKQSLPPGKYHRILITFFFATIVFCVLFCFKSFDAFTYNQGSCASWNMLDFKSTPGKFWNSPWFSIHPWKRKFILNILKTTANQAGSLDLTSSLHSCQNNFFCGVNFQNTEQVRTSKCWGQNDTVCDVLSSTVWNDYHRD